MSRAALVGVAALSCLATAARAHADCKPAAIASGDPALVAQLGERLAASGIATTATADCPALRVQVSMRGDRVHLAVTDTFARTGEREVRDVATAATIVESWTLQEVEAGTLPEEPAIVEAAAPAPVAASALGARFETAVADNAALWLGVAVTGCRRVGPVCVGALARGAHATGSTTTAAHGTDQIHALATVELPRRLGAFTLAPGIAVGYGWLRVSSTHLDIHAMPFEVIDGTHELRADVHVELARSLGRGIGLYAQLTGDTALLRSDGTADPRTFFRAALGARFEVR
ncbi:MAG TPA: hypothetical protein VFQ53_32550 [Kofleriaceae bacterium]|nr:hypothetical protein [Kofleriaceae bacterium]